MRRRTTGMGLLGRVAGRGSNSGGVPGRGRALPRTTGALGSQLTSNRSSAPPDKKLKLTSPSQRTRDNGYENQDREKVNTNAEDSNQPTDEISPGTQAYTELRAFQQQLFSQQPSDEIVHDWRGRLNAAFDIAGIDASARATLPDHALVNLANRQVLGEVEAIALLQQLGQVTGLLDWIKFGATKTGSDLVRVTGELREARRLVQENPDSVLNIGGDERAPVDTRRRRPVPPRAVAISVAMSGHL